MRILKVLAITLCSLSMLAQSAPADLQHAARLILVTTPDWNSVGGTLTRYSRVGEKWNQVGEPIPVVVGKNGLAWDPQLANGHSDQFPGPVKHEGDGRSPAGTFRLGDSFGFADSPSDIQNYRPLTPATECVDDVNSKHYAQIVDRSSIKDVDWNSSEKMRSVDLYRWGIVVPYNMSPTIAGNGSCIFLHIWRGAGQGTAGCTAMPEEALLNTIHWMNSKAPNAILVHLPESEYQRFQTEWSLP